MIAPEEALRRQMERLDSPRRITWLREQARDYVVDLAARHYFALPTWCAGVEVPDPMAEATAAVIGFGTKAALTPAEIHAAFTAEWNAAVAIAEKVGEKLRIIALGHIKLTRSSDGIAGSLIAARSRFPDGWPFLTETDLTNIASSFQRAPMRTRRAA